MWIPYKALTNSFYLPAGLVFGLYWPRFHTPQIIFIQTLLDQLSVRIREASPVCCNTNSIKIQYYIFPKNAKALSYRMQSCILNDYYLHVPIKTVIATDASQSEVWAVELEYFLLFLISRSLFASQTSNPSFWQNI